MKTKVLAIMAAAALALAPVAGCAPILQGGSPFEQTLTDEKALYGVEAAIHGANTLASSAVDTGLLVPGSPKAVQVADLLEKARGFLLAARAAYNAGNAIGGARAAAQAFEAVATVQAILRPQPG